MPWLSRRPGGAKNMSAIFVMVGFGLPSTLCRAASDRSTPSFEYQSIFNTSPRARTGVSAEEPFNAFPSAWTRSEGHTSELQSLMRISYAVFCLKKKKKNDNRLRCKRHNTQN